jgi:hypothetical protein
MLAVGVVLNPDGGGRPRISLDFTHIDKRDEISVAHSADVGFFLANEGRFPGRVVRAPLTAADAAAGFTGGVVTQIDATALNVGATTSDAVDLQADYLLRLGMTDSLRFHGLATWEPRLTRRAAPDKPSLSYVGFTDGPLRWRGNLGVDWTHDDLILGLNGQYYGSNYNIYAATASPGGVAAFDTPGVHIPAQVYVDASLTYRFRPPAAFSPVRDLELRAGIEDLLDRSVPLVTGAGTLGFSYYGDPRGRRFEASLTAHF